jgi:hypothetical protein
MALESMPGVSGSTLARRWFFRLLVVVTLIGVAELGSLVIFRYREGEWFSFSRIRKLQRTIEYSNGQPNPGTGQTSNLYVIHPYLGVVLNPAYPGPMPLEGPITEFGFCDVGPPVHQRADNQVIVGIVGGSVASIFARQGRDTLIEELKRSPDFAGKDIVVVNLAVGGFKQPQQMMALNYALALGAEFDVLLNIDGFNEVALYPPENWAAGIHPLYPRSWHLFVRDVTDATSQRLLAEVFSAQRQRRQWARLFRKSILKNSVMMNLLWSVGDRYHQGEITRCTRALQQWKPPALPYRARGPLTAFSNEEVLYQELVTIWKRCSLQLHRTCKGHGIAYYHFLQPNQYDEGAKAMGGSERRVAWLDNHPGKHSVEVAYPLLRAAGKSLVKEGVNFHDLTMIFRDHPEPIYVDTCCHFGRAGNVILARAIAAILTSPTGPSASSHMASGTRD